MRPGSWISLTTSMTRCAVVCDGVDRADGWPARYQGQACVRRSLFLLAVKPSDLTATRDAVASADFRGSLASGDGATASS